MRMKAIERLRSVTRWIRRVLEARLPMEAMYGLRGVSKSRFKRN